jgi:hypothetical protein
MGILGGWGWGSKKVMGEVSGEALHSHINCHMRCKLISWSSWCLGPGNEAAHVHAITIIAKNRDIYPARACAARGKTVSSMDSKNARSRDLGVWATRKRNESVEMVVKLFLLCLESFGKAYERRKNCVLLATPINRTPTCFWSCAQLNLRR